MLANCKYIIAALLMLSSSSYVHADEVKKTKCGNPFEMVIFNLGSGRFANPKISSGSFVAMPSTTSKNKIIELGVEVPWYKQYTAFGFQFDIINGQRMKGAEYTLSVKFRLPFHCRFGHIALTNSYRAGLVTIFAFENIDNDYETFQFGVIGVPVIGIDYFPIRWLGVYCEYSWRFANVFLNRRPIENASGKTIGHNNNSFSYRTTGISAGIKLTF